MRKSIKNHYIFGFTLVELLVVMAILGILTVVTLGNFRTSQIKARDAQRKHDLREITSALEAYYNDHSTYPPASDVTSGGMIKACGCNDSSCDWTIDLGTRDFCDTNKTVYMSKVPGDPTGDPYYCYYSENNLYRLYAKLENKNDPDILTGGTRTCATVGGYNFGISSSNTLP